jgi:hypothetical protein
MFYAQLHEKQRTRSSFFTPVKYNTEICEPGIQTRNLETITFARGLTTMAFEALCSLLDLIDAAQGIVAQELVDSTLLSLTGCTVLSLCSRICCANEALIR